MIRAKELRLIQTNEFNYNNLERDIREFAKKNPTKRNMNYQVEKNSYIGFKNTMTKLGYETMSFDESGDDFIVKIYW